MYIHYTFYILFLYAKHSHADILLMQVLWVWVSITCPLFLSLPKNFLSLSPYLHYLSNEAKSHQYLCKSDRKYFYQRFVSEATLTLFNSLVSRETDRVCFSVCDGKFYHSHPVKISSQTSRQAKTNIFILPGEPKSNYGAANYREVRFIWRNRLKKRAKRDVYLKETENLDSFLCHIVAVSLQTFFPSTSQSLEGFRTENSGALWNPFFPKFHFIVFFIQIPFFLL